MSILNQEFVNRPLKRYDIKASICKAIFPWALYILVLCWQVKYAFNATDSTFIQYGFFLMRNILGPVQ